MRNGKVTGEAGEELAKKLGNLRKMAPTKSMLTKLLGPYGVAVDVVWEAADIGFSVLGGKPVDEAVRDNWITGTIIETLTGDTEQKAYHRKLVKKDSSTKLMSDALNLEEDLNKMYKNLKVMEGDIGTLRSKLRPEDIKNFKKEIAEKEQEWMNLTKEGTLVEPGSNAYENYMRAKTEEDDKRKATSYASRASLAYQLDARESDRYKPREISPVKIDFKLPENYTTFKADLPTTEDINKMWQTQGFEGTVPTDLAKEFITEEKWRQLFTDPKAAVISGTQDWRGAAGGLTRTVAPDSGPMSQGLASTPEYDTYSKEYKWQT